MASLKYKDENGVWRKVNAGASYDANLAAHTNDKNNPHGVTAEQIGALSANDTEQLATVIETLFENGGVNTLRSAIQITNAVLIGSGTAFTGTGKGKLFLTGTNESIIADITIDGTQLSSVKFSNTGSTIEIEFLESFSVHNSSNSYYIYANAVFY